MKKYHILFKDNENLLISKGENFVANNEVEAIFNFRMKYPTAKFLCIYDLEEFSHLYR